MWNQNRKKIAPSFSLNMLQRFFNTFVEESLMLTNKLEKVGINGNEIIFLEYIATCALDIACSKNMQFVLLLHIVKIHEKQVIHVLTPVSSESNFKRIISIIKI